MSLEKFLDEVITRLSRDPELVGRPELTAKLARMISDMAKPVEPLSDAEVETLDPGIRELVVKLRGRLRYDGLR